MEPEAFDRISEDTNEDKESLSEDESLTLSNMSLSAPRFVFLPDEIILNVISHLNDTFKRQESLWSCCLVSRRWYSCAVPFLYARPNLYGKNFDPFVRTICPSVNSRVRKSPLAGYVRRLDMGKLVHQGSKSLTARLLSRLKNGLEEFIAPRASFAINCCAVLSKCTKLRLLDLSLVSVYIPVNDFQRCLAHLENLRVVFIPHMSLARGDISHEHHILPAKLREMHVLHSAYPEEFIVKDSRYPLTIDTLTIQHYKHTPQSIVDKFLQKFAPNLRVLRLTDRPRVLSDLLHLFPNLQQLSILLSPLCEVSPPNDTHSLESIDSHGLEYLELLFGDERFDALYNWPTGFSPAIIFGSLPRFRGMCLPKTTTRSPEVSKDIDSLNSFLLERFGINSSVEDVKQHAKTSMTLRAMVEQNVVGVWTAYELYDIREELLRHYI